MAQVKDITIDLERHQQVLEETISTLRNSLQHWQKWYLEYAALKEEVVGPDSQAPSRKDLARIRRDFDGELLDKKEVNEIFGKHDLKDPEQILSVLSRRMDYVERNVDTLGQQLEVAENKLAASMVIANPDGGTDEESGLPITDIIEQLDDDGNVVDFRLQTGNDSGPKVLEALRKAGMDDLAAEASEHASETPSYNPQTGQTDASGTAANDSTAPVVKQSSLRKSVSFAEDTKDDHDAEQQPVSRAARRLEEVIQTARDQEKNMLANPAATLDDESTDDAQLRREMLEYGMSEIGPVVAELQLEEGSDEEFDYTDEDDDDEEDDEEVDELGRSKYSVITDDYRQRMQELEKRLGVTSAFTAEPLTNNPIPEEGIGRISIVGQTSSTPAPSTNAQTDEPPKPAAKKGVRFAGELDVAPSEEATIPAPSLPKGKEPEINPLSDIVERTTKTHPKPENPSRRPSRFKKERGTGSSSALSHVPSGPHEAPVRFLDEERGVTPSGPDGQTLADAVIERDVSSDAREPDEFDATLLHQQAAVEFNRIRNRLIQKQGGFLKEEEAEITPLDEEEGGPKRMSRFKAARLSRQ
jgi:unconventional prefoldin RPB5 interactor 1